ncbi:hypothetical protein P1A29_10700 [Staphylococcus equorum]|uniref:hypothetical protein n=1 Tax=Staphylococcus equorum TaxID=246432 RepID=UPI002556CD77|nr:hypothetical protein [Staphylococcus equorum]MDK9860905.1 hypothetical protein [Staphylococcus equorum]
MLRIKYNKEVFFSGLIYCVIIASLLLINYIIVFHIIKLIFHYSNSDLLSIITPFMTILGIGMTGFVAIFVMKKNHSHEISILKRNEIKNDIIKQREVEYLLQQISIISLGYGRNLNSTSDLQRITIPHINKELNEIQSICKDIRIAKFTNINDRQIENLEVCDLIVNQVKSAEIDLLYSGYLIQINELKDRFRKVYNLIYDHASKSNNITLKDKKFKMN